LARKKELGHAAYRESFHQLVSTEYSQLHKGGSTMNALWLVCVVSGAHPALEAAQKASARGDFEQVMPLVLEARAAALTDAEAALTWELEALTRAAFDDELQAVEAFRKLLALAPTFTPPENWSPKVAGLFERARLKAAAAPVLLPLVKERVDLDVRPPPPLPVTQRWWFWTGVGVLVAGGITGVVLAATVQTVPNGSLGSGDLK
jgi:hypothetical protein